MRRDAVDVELLDAVVGELSPEHDAWLTLCRRLARYLRGAGELTRALALADRVEALDRGVGRLLRAELLIDAGRAAEGGRLLASAAVEAVAEPARLALLRARARFLSGDHAGARAAVAEAGAVAEPLLAAQLSNVAALAAIYSGEPRAGPRATRRCPRGRARCCGGGRWRAGRRAGARGAAAQLPGDRAAASGGAFEGGGRLPSGVGAGAKRWRSGAGDDHHAQRSDGARSARRARRSAGGPTARRRRSLRGPASRRPAPRRSPTPATCWSRSARSTKRTRRCSAPRASPGPPGPPPQLGHTLLYLAELAAERGELDRAEDLHGEAVGALSDDQLGRDAADLLAAELAIRRGEPQRALTLASGLVERLDPDDPDRGARPRAVGARGGGLRAARRRARAGRRGAGAGAGAAGRRPRRSLARPRGCSPGLIRSRATPSRAPFSAARSCGR